MSRSLDRACINTRAGVGPTIAEEVSTRQRKRRQPANGSRNAAPSGNRGTRDEVNSRRSPGYRVIAEREAATIVFPYAPPVFDGFVKDSGPQLTLIQLLPSSTVADGTRLNSGAPAIESGMPGGTPKPWSPPHPFDTVHSGGTREPLQYWAITAGSLLELPFPV